MRFDPPLVRGTLLRRYKRFLADVRLDDDRVVVAHCPNSGSMLSVDAPGSEVWLAPSDNPARKLLWTWTLIRVGDTLVGIDTARPNRIVAEAIVAGEIPELVGYRTLRREVKYGRNSRIDLLLELPGRPTCLVEVKNVTMKRGPGSDVPVEFPDAVTARGAKHLVELSEARREGTRAVMFFLAQRDDADRLGFASDIDSSYSHGLRIALDAGVECLCYRCRIDPREIVLDRRIGIDLPIGASAASTQTVESTPMG